METSAQNRIAFLCHPYHRGGVTRWMADAAASYADAGREVYFVTVSPSQPFHSGKKAETMMSLLEPFKQKIKVISRRVTRLFELGTPEYRVSLYCDLLQANVPAGIPIITSDDSDVWQAAAKMKKSYPFVAGLHGDEPKYYSNALKYRYDTDVFVCVSQRIAKKLKEQLAPEDHKKVFVIPCGIHLPEFRPDLDPDRKPALAYLGRIAEYQKRVSDLFGLASTLHKNNISFTLTIIGDGGKDKDNLVARIQQSEVRDLVTFTGWKSKSEVQDLLRHTDILVLTSDFDGTPVSMMEALANGCAFAGTRVSGIEDYENDPLAADCFRIFDVGNLEEAAVKIAGLSKIDKQKRAESARKLAVQEFEMSICLQRYDKAISLVSRIFEPPDAMRLSPGKVLQSRLLYWRRSLQLAIGGRG